VLGGPPVTATPVADATHSNAIPLTATIGALGVVYGDIGTSPLYALKEAAKAAAHGGPLTSDPVLGVVSLILWALILIISLKYALLILRADNRGEGGIVALLALLSARNAQPGSWRAQLLVVGLVGAALLYGDGAITPAISVLSAIEGLKVDAPSLAPAVVPLTIIILIGLFVVQKKGAGFIGKIFGPVMLAWFLVIALLGIDGIVRAPAVLAAVSPFYAVDFLIHQDFHISFAILGAAFLAVTGGEAMYADMGHFGRMPIRLAWFAVALPALVLNYFGQAALLITDSSAIENPFYQLAPDWFHYPLVAFATVATVIASQAIISGVFSLTQQSIQLGFLPRMHIKHTTSSAIGQIYVPLVNWLLAAATLGAVIGFGTSDALAGAYGIVGFAVDGDHDIAGGPGRDPVGLFAGHRDRGQRLLLRDRLHLLCGEFDQAVRGWLVSAAARGRRRVPDADLAQRRQAGRTGARQVAPAGGGSDRNRRHQMPRTA
jgi:KUP system potassium uptake protein